MTSNKDLQTIFTYCWGDYGTIPSKSHFSMQAELIAHFQYGKSRNGFLHTYMQKYNLSLYNISNYSTGGFYPIGGASEIALNMIPVIERT